MLSIAIPVFGLLRLILIFSFKSGINFAKLFDCASKALNVLLTFSPISAAVTARDFAKSSDSAEDLPKVKARVSVSCAVSAIGIFNLFVLERSFY